MLKWSGYVSLGLWLAACGVRPSPTLFRSIAPTSAPTLTPTPTPTPTPAVTATSVASTDVQALVRIPEVEGVRYRALVPDTLDLHERAELVLGTMTRCTDSSTRRAAYMRMHLNQNPPVLKYTTVDWDGLPLGAVQGKYVEAASLLRRVTGSTPDRDVLEAWRRSFLDVHADYPFGFATTGRVLAWLADNYRYEGDPGWRALCDEAVERIWDGMVFKKDFCYVPGDGGAMPTGWDATWNGWTLQGLTRAYLATGDARTLELAGRLATYLKDHAGVFDAHGRFIARQPSDNGPALHFHGNGNALEGLASYALATNDRQIAAFAKSSYEWARSTGSRLVGFFPEYINSWPDDRGFIDCETCAVADMIQTAMTLSQAGEGDYWDDVDRYVRNQFAEMQLLDGAWIDRRAATYPRQPVASDEDADHVSTRVVGSFASWAAGNDWVTQGTEGTTFCCIGNGGRALYHVWDNMLAFERGTLTIHLLLNRASPWADVASRVPYTGRADISVKVGGNLEVRMPEWVKASQMAASVNGVTRPLSATGRYVLVGRVEPGDAVSVTFPISERTVRTTIGGEPYTLVIKGNDVVAIDPPGTWYPFYQRGRYRQDKVAWVMRDRFVAST
jgi:hypothetical protein